MNIHKHMEAIFIAALAVVGTGAFALDSVTLADASPAAPVLRATAGPAAAPAAVVCAARAARRM